MQSVSWDYDDVPSLIDEVGVEEVGRLYATRKMEDLRALTEDRYVASVWDDDPLSWIDDCVADGDYLDSDLRFRLVIAAINAATTDAVLWCIGDRPVAHLAALDGFDHRFHDARRTNPNVERLFRLMQHDATVVEGAEDSGWWSDDYRELGYGSPQYPPGARRPQ